MKRGVLSKQRGNLSRSAEHRRALLLKKNSEADSRPSSTVKPKSYLDDPQCNELREQLLKDKDFESVETEQLLSLLSHLREHSQSCALQENYKDAKKSRDLANDVREELKKRETVKKTVQDRQGEIAEMNNKFEESWKNKKQEYNEETKKKHEELKEQQAHQLRTFERVWKEEMPHKYRKPSNELLQLRQIEKSLAISGNIDEADDVHRKADILQNQEALKAQNKLVVDYQKAKRRLLRNHKKEEQQFLDERERYRQILDYKYDLEKEKLDNRTNVVNKRYIAASKEVVKENIAAYPTKLPQDRKQLGTLLPPLVPPNNPQYVEIRKRRMEEITKLQTDYHNKKMAYANEEYY